MSWETKQDYCGLSETTGITTKQVTHNTTNQFLEKLGKNGTIAYQNAFGKVSNPSNEYLIEKACDLKFNLGQVTTVDGKRFALQNVSAKVGAGTEPTLSASAVEIEATPDGDDQAFADVTFSLSPEEVVQTVMDAYTLSGDDCEETEATFTAECTVSPHTKNGVPKASGVHTGKVTVQLTIGQYGEAAPTVTPKDGWKIQNELTCDEPDADTPRWTVTLVKPLAKKSA